MKKVLDEIKRMPVIGILRGFTEEQTFRILEVYQECGYSLAEITWNTPNAGAIIRKANKEFESLVIGAGTICSIEDYLEAKKAGAAFIVTPILNEEVISSCVHEDIPVFPGSYSPTEIYRAWRLGATMVKVFPSGTLGSGYIRELQGPLPQIPLVPTGGINLDNVEAFLKAGAKGLGMGGGLFMNSLIQEGKWADLKDHFMAFREKVVKYISV